VRSPASLTSAIDPGTGEAPWPGHEYVRGWGVPDPVASRPLASWRSPLLNRARERLSRALGLGRLRLCGVMPSGHTGLLMPERMYLV
jgi:hypothetical protein